MDLSGFMAALSAFLGLERRATAQEKDGLRMTKKLRIDGAVLAMLFALLLAPLAVSPVYELPVVLAVAFGCLLFLVRYRVRWSGPDFFRGFLSSELGAVSVLYFVRGANGVTILGSATGPTGQQAAQCFKQTAQINMADADTQALFTHSWGLDASAPGYFEPEILWYAQQMTANGTWATALTFDVTNTNVVKVNKANFAQSGGTFIVTLRRPHTVGQ